MRFILSRKGYDSQFGGNPSPVFKTTGQLLDGFLYSIPIPECESKGNSFDYHLPEPLIPIGFPINTRYFHLDPDIRPELHRELPPNWCPILGQSDAAAQHLKNQNVGINDIFLFFGLFQDVEWNRNYNQWVFGNSKPYHAIWGYMQIKDIKKVDDTVRKQYPWHPHCQIDYHSENQNNTLYIGSSGNLTLKGLDDCISYGTFKNDNKLRLTKIGAPLTQWSSQCLPWLDVSKKQSHMSYHDENCFQKGFFQAAFRGQEFVTDDFDNESDILEKVLNWFKDLVKLRTDFPRKLLQ